MTTNFTSLKVQALLFMLHCGIMGRQQMSCKDINFDYYFYSYFSSSSSSCSPGFSHHMGEHDIMQIICDKIR